MSSPTYTGACMVETGLGSIVLGIGIIVVAAIVYRTRRG